MSTNEVIVYSMYLYNSPVPCMYNLSKQIYIQICTLSFARKTYGNLKTTNCMILYLFMFKKGKIKPYKLTFIWYKTVCCAYFILFKFHLISFNISERFIFTIKQTIYKKVWRTNNQFKYKFVNFRWQLTSEISLITCQV